VDVHAKLLIVDDQLVRIGSANLHNRSMGADVECDLFVTAEDRDDIRHAIVRLRNRLLGEHCGVDTEAFAAAVARDGGVVPAIIALGGGTRSLEVFALETEPPWSPTLVSATRLADPEKPIDIDTLTALIAPDLAVRSYRSAMLVAAALLLCGAMLAAAWY
jgi:hypothetical protein